MNLFAPPFRITDLRLTRTQRLRAGCAVALLYLLCVLTPTIALALPGMATPDCLVTDGAATAMGHVHNHASAESQHHMLHSGHGGAAVHDMAMMNIGDEPSSNKAPAHGSAGASCCELMCLTALPAMFADVSAPDQPVSRHRNEASRIMSDNAPPSHYRPPISLS